MPYVNNWIKIAIFGPVYMFQIHMQTKTVTCKELFQSSIYVSYIQTMSGQISYLQVGFLIKYIPTMPDQSCLQVAIMIQ